MKLIALKDFAVNKSSGIKLAKGSEQPHPNQISKGTRFSIGDTEILEDLTEEDKGRVWTLVRSSKSALIDNTENKALIEKLDAEVAADAAAAVKAADAAVKANAPMEERIAAAVVKALLEAGFKPAKAGA